MSGTALTWLGMAVCLSQSATFSGLNLALFRLSRLELQVEVAGGNHAAERVLALREDSNLVLTTILWGNVAVNVLLALLADSVLTGAMAFLFSTVFITLFGEIVPQAYFSRHALRMASMLAPVLRLYQMLLYPVVKPSAWLLDIWLGKESIAYFREVDLKQIIRLHMESDETEVDRLEAIGALNFLTIDDLAVGTEGTALDPASVVCLPFRDGRPQFPAIARDPADPFLRQVNASGKTWVVVVDEAGEPRRILEANLLLRAALFGEGPLDPHAYCHAPVVIRDPKTALGHVISELRFDRDKTDDHVIRHDTILLWTDEPRLITGSDLLGRLLRGILRRTSANGAAPEAGAERR